MLLRLSLALTLVGVLVASLPAQAAVFAVSGKPVGDPNLLTSIGPLGNRTDVAVNLANGFPLWYQDQAGGNKYQLCLDSTLEVAPGVVVNPCEYEPPLAAPPSFPGNFGAEAIYWSAVIFGNYTSTGSVNSAVLLDLGLQATGANEAALADGNQAVFSRVRLRIDVPVAGTYQITHPFGTRTYIITPDDFVTTLGRRAINQTQDFGLLDPPVGPGVAQNFLAAMADSDPLAPPVEPVPFLPSSDAGIVNADGLNIGPFLVPAATPFNPVTFIGGPVTVGTRSYIGLPFAPNPLNPLVPLNVAQPAVGSPLNLNTNFLRIQLLNPPAGFQLNPSNLADPQTVQFDNFQMIGKLFNDGPNLAPVATDDLAATAINRSVTIDVVANDLDAVSGLNSHGLNVQALAVANNDGPILNAVGMPAITATHPTTEGGTVRRVINTSTGRGGFLYTPRSGFTGIDTFRYVVQDSGGLISAPATVSITVEDLQVSRADYRPRINQWRVSGTSTDLSDNRVTLTASPRARLTPEAEVATPAVTSSARGTVSLRVGASSIDFMLNVDPLPATSITSAHIHVGAPGTNGPIIFSLYQSIIDGPFTGNHSGTLQSFNLESQPSLGVSSFSDAINAILSGNAYVNVHTGAFPSGEIRGQLSRPTIGTADVIEGRWEFKGHSKASPGGLPGVIVESANGIRLLNRLSIR